MVQKIQEYIFTYKGVDYDASDFVQKHPGGPEFIKNMRLQRKDFTQYFKSIHSQQAQKILMSFKQSGKKPNSKQTQRYFRILDKVKHLYDPNWIKQFFFITFVTITFFTACLTTIPLISILFFGLSQVITGWLAHSMNHSRNKNLYRIGYIIGPILIGISGSWWGSKHNMHHMFTNSTKYDDDIKNSYNTVFYPLLYFKWRFDAAIYSIRKLKLLDIIFILINYYLLSRQKLIYFILGIMAGGFYSAHLLLAIHERERRYNNEIRDQFIEHKIVTCRNFPYQNFFWLIIMGGMQYQTEHHLFPQIPFYNLPTAKTIIAEELRLIGKQVKVGLVMNN